MIKLKTSRPRPKVLTARQAQTILDACDHLRDRLLFAVLLDCGWSFSTRCSAGTMPAPAPPHRAWSCKPVRQAKTAGVSSLLNRSEQQGRQTTGSRVREPVLFLLDAQDAVESRRDETGWEIEYAKDV